ncbi:PqqD family protein [Kiritimatiellota bacterium B12222]|nr:PqqD family protein [Kiritimatiellota bacterium B12222]
MESLKVFRVNAPDVVAEAIDGEVVVIHMTQGVYYSLEQSAGYLWELIEKGFSAQRMVEGVREAFSDVSSEVEKDIQSFLEELCQRGLILAAESPETEAALPVGEEKGAYQKPKVEVFEDMQDLLLADPIHDFDGQPWPGPAQG